MAETVGFGAPITPTAGIEHRVNSHVAVAPAQNRNGQARPSVSEEAIQSDLGTVVAAVVRQPASQGPPAGAQLLLRIVAPIATTAGLLTGEVGESTANETLLSTPIGLLTLKRKLALPPGTQIAFVVIDTMAPEVEAATAPAGSGGWIALEETLFALLAQAPELAEQLRGALAPRSATELAGTLFYLLGALYQGNWPGPIITRMLNDSGHVKLGKRLADDIAALRRLGEDRTTGEWRVLTVPLLLGNFALALRLYLQRRRPAAQDGVRFALEVELSRLGPMQIDCLVRGKHLILVLRSHRDLPPELRDAMRAIFRRALDTVGINGDLSFATVAIFLVHPLDQLREHIQITA